MDGGARSSLSGVAIWSRLGPPLALMVGGLVSVARHDPPLVWAGSAAAAVVAMLVLAGQLRFRRRVPAEPRIQAVFVAVAAAVLGAAGHPAVAVLAAAPLAWALPSEADEQAGAGAVGLAVVVSAVCAIGARRLSGGEALATLAGVAMAGAALAAGRLRAHEVGFVALQGQELRRIRAEMVTTVSHELRTPLTVIQGVTSTLSRRWDVLSEPERLDLIDVLAENVASLDASILHFADAARLERGSMRVTPEWTDVADALSAAMARRAGPLAGHPVQQDLQAAEVWVDRAALERILEHLLLNAARFSPLGSPIRVRVSVIGDQAEVTVADRGQGIAPRLLATVWEPLQRGDVSDTGVSRGAGLGLPIVRELARLHGGDATLSSARGRGTTVTVVLPQPDRTNPHYRS